jgi:hypothetical protein
MVDVRLENQLNIKGFKVSTSLMLDVVAVIFPEAIYVVVLGEILGLVFEVQLPELCLVTSRLDDFDHQRGVHKVHLELHLFNLMAK